MLPQNNASRVPLLSSTIHASAGKKMLTLLSQNYKIPHQISVWKFLRDSSTLENLSQATKFQCTGKKVLKISNLNYVSVSIKPPHTLKNGLKKKKAPEGIIEILQ